MLYFQRARQCMECQSAMIELRKYFNDQDNQLTMKAHFVRSCQLIFDDYHHKHENHEHDDHHRYHHGYSFGRYGRGFSKKHKAYGHHANYLMRLVSSSDIVALLIHFWTLYNFFYLQGTKKNLNQTPCRTNPAALYKPIKFIQTNIIFVFIKKKKFYIVCRNLKAITPIKRYSFPGLDVTQKTILK